MLYFNFNLFLELLFPTCPFKLGQIFQSDVSVLRICLAVDHILLKDFVRQSPDICFVNHDNFTWNNSHN